MALDFLQGGDQDLKLIFESLLPFSDQQEVASAHANNPQQRCFPFLERSLPVLDNLRRPLIDFNERYFNGNCELDCDDALVIMKVSVALRHRLDRVLSPETRDGYRVILPMDHLQKTQVLQGMRILDVSADEDASEIMKSMGASAVLLSPYEESIDGEDFEFPTDLTRATRADKLTQKLRSAIDGLAIFDLILADRRSLHNAFATEEEIDLELPNPPLEQLIKGIHGDRYRHNVSLGSNGGLEPLKACEVFVPYQIRPVK